MANNFDAMRMAVQAVFPTNDVLMDDKDELYRAIGKIAKASREGCPFCSRCAQATERCRGEMPEQREVTEGHFVSCHLYE